MSDKCSKKLLEAIMIKYMKDNKSEDLISPLVGLFQG
jgi:hypothetical protein